MSDAERIALTEIDRLERDRDFWHRKWDDIVVVRANLQAKLERLQAIVDELLLTADGVPATPGMELVNSADKRRWLVGTSVAPLGRHGDPSVLTFGSMKVSDLYSSEEAAEAARKGTLPKETAHA